MKNIGIIFCLLFIGLNSIMFSQTPTMPSGSGTLGDPYVISTLNELYWVTQNTTSWNKYFVQSADIVASSTNTWDSDGSGGYYGFSPIGNSTTAFSGTYNGQGFNITDLYINRSGANNVGFFGRTNSATISNVKLVNLLLRGDSQIGGIVGFKMGGTVSSCSVSGIISSDSSNANDIGGIAGYNSSGSITECFTTATVTTIGFRAGGITGYDDGSTTKCYSTGNITASLMYAGGIAGIANGTISDCYSLGRIASSENVGGIAGTLNISSASATRCYAVGSISGNPKGGLVGKNRGTFSGSFWNTDTISSGVGDNALATFACVGKTTAEMKSQSTYTDSSWDFTTVWQMIGTNYPDLRSNPNPALPVELTSFSASVINGGVALKWSTATEINNYGFEIQRAVISNQSSEKRWNNIGFVEGAGNSNLPKSYSFVDMSAQGKIVYRLKQIDRDGKFEYSQAVEVIAEQTPKPFALSQNYPNPFNPITVINYQLPTTNHVSLKVFDAIGREIATLVNEMKEAGSFSAVFDATSISSGIYFFQIKAGNFIQMKKMVLIK